MRRSHLQLVMNYCSTVHWKSSRYKIVLSTQRLANRIWSLNRNWNDLRFYIFNHVLCWSVLHNYKCSCDVHKYLIQSIKVDMPRSRRALAYINWHKHRPEALNDKLIKQIRFYVLTRLVRDRKLWRWSMWTNVLHLQSDCNASHWPWPIVYALSTPLHGLASRTLCSACCQVTSVHTVTSPFSNCHRHP